MFCFCFFGFLLGEFIFINYYGYGVRLALGLCVVRFFIFEDYEFFCFLLSIGKSVSIYSKYYYGVMEVSMGAKFKFFSF